MSKHTPGPWYMAGKTVYALNEQGFNRFSALVQDAHTGDEELEANARLIAASPDLLDALVGLIAITTDSAGVSGYHLNGAIAEWDEFEEVAAAIAAIAKATGVQP